MKTDIATTMSVRNQGPAGDGVALALGYRRLIKRRIIWLACLGLALVASVTVNIMTGPADLGAWQLAVGILSRKAWMGLCG